MTRITTFTLATIVFACCVFASGQTPKNLTKEGLSFDYPDGWMVTDDTNDDVQQFTLTKANSDVQIGVFVHKGRISHEKLADAKKAFIDPYVAARGKQFVQMGATPEQSADTSEIAGVKADGVVVKASLGGETGAAKVYWALVGTRVVMLSLFGPDDQTKKEAAAWDLVRNSLKIIDPKATPAASPKASP